MSPLRHEEELLDERVLANWRKGHTRANAQQSVSAEDKEGLNTISSRQQPPTPNLPDGTEDPCTVYALRHPSDESTADGPAAQDRINAALQPSSEHLCSVPEASSPSLDSSNCRPPTTRDEPIPCGKTGPQDQDDRHTFPEGGLRAWLVVIGAFSGMTASFGLLNSAGTFQAYLSTHQLVHESPSAVGWIFSLEAFLTFFCGVQIGPIFDAYGPRWLVFAGSVCLLGGLIGAAESTSKCCLLLYIIPWRSFSRDN